MVFVLEGRKGDDNAFSGNFYWAPILILEGELKWQTLVQSLYKPLIMAAMNLPTNVFSLPIRNKALTAGLTEIQYLRGRVNQSTTQRR